MSLNVSKALFGDDNSCNAEGKQCRHCRRRPSTSTQPFTNSREGREECNEQQREESREIPDMLLQPRSSADGNDHTGTPQSNEPLAPDHEQDHAAECDCAEPDEQRVNNNRRHKTDAHSRVNRSCLSYPKAPIRADRFS
jgi:hypothetical protein